MPSLGVEMIRVATDSALLRINDRGGEKVDLQVADLTVPLQSDGSMYVYYSHTEPNRFVSAEDVLAGRTPA